MALEMKPICEKCETGLTHDAEVHICSFECTFCGPCTVAMDHICPNCGGDLVRRPRRKMEG
jgi:hypothetical protein